MYRSNEEILEGGASYGQRRSVRGATSDLIRRATEFALALLLIVAFAPLLLLLATIIRVKLGGPVLFRQSRPGFEGKPFHLVKFRSMTDERGAGGELLPDAQRLTPFGRMLRATSLDELPELWNVLKGEMSFVGPRPLLMEYLPLYSPEQSRRHQVRPGITGWAQVNGRNTIGWDEKLKLDVWYVDNRSFWLDLKIIAMTVRSVLARADINAPGHATAAKFSGTLKVQD